MLEILRSYDLSAVQWIMVSLSGVLVGIAKTGIGGAGMLAIPVLAGIFGGKSSAGIFLPMLCIGDIVGVSYYHRHASWHHLWRLIPWALAGIILGVLVGNAISDTQFKWIMGITILAGITIMTLQENRRNRVEIPDSRWFAALMGIVGGFTSMMGNAAVPVMALYLLSMRIPKYTFIGTWAWFFLIVNLVKVPFHVLVWKTITVETVLLDLAMIPAIAAGALVGVALVKKISEKTYRTFIIAMTALAAVRLFF